MTGKFAKKTIQKITWTNSSEPKTVLVVTLLYVCNVLTRDLFYLVNPFKDPKIPKDSDCYKTIFVARLSYATTEERLIKEFEIFGDIDYVRIVKDLKGKSKGYGFITFRREKDAAYAREKGDGRRVENRRILVDKELGRTKQTWLPKRLGGGKGGETRQGPTDYLVDEVKREIRKE